MPFRISLAFAMLVLSLNVSVAFNIEKANPIEKGVVFAASLILLSRGKIDWRLVPAIVIMIFATVLSASFTRYTGFEWDFYLRQMINFLTLMIFLTVIPSETDRFELLRTMSYVPLLQLGIGVAYAVLGLKPLFSVDSTIGVPRLNGSSIPAFMAGVAVCGALAAMFYAEQKNHKYIWLAAINAIICLLTAGRMATFVLLLSCGGYFFFGFARFRHLKIPLLFGALIAGAILFAMIGDSLVARAMSGDEKGRDIVRYYLLRFYESYPDFGVGFGHSYTIFSREIIVQTGVVAAHNEYLKYLVELGEVGGSIFAVGWLVLFVNTALSSINRERSVYAIIILAFLIYSITDNTLVRTDMSMIIVIAAYGTRRPNLAANPKRVAAANRPQQDDRRGFARTRRRPAPIGLIQPDGKSFP